MFYSELNRYGQNIAVIEGQQKLSYQQLEQKCAEFAQQIEMPDKSLFFIKAQNSIATLIAYLTVMRQKHCAMLISPDINESQLKLLFERYRPSAMIEQDKVGLPLVKTLTFTGAYQIDTKVRLLLSTSGSTGSPKFVALSDTNLQANAESICEYLPIKTTDKTITTLSFFYSYGLSVINSHLLVGACVVFTTHSVVNREFWTLFKHHNINSFSGVPHTYEMLLKLKFDRMVLPSLRYFTQAGGQLDKEKVLLLAEFAEKYGISFFLMYGQTEATARISFLSSENTKNKPHAIGKAIPGGYLYLRSKTGELITGQYQQGELCYKGPNVMLGYAEGADDLKEFKPLIELETGDLAFQDDDEDFVICGRLKRIIKLFGLRINLDEVEALLKQHDIENICTGTDSSLIVGVKKLTDVDKIKKWLSKELRINHSAIVIKQLESFPMTSNGKKDYTALLQNSGNLP